MCCLLLFLPVQKETQNRQVQCNTNLDAACSDQVSFPLPAYANLRWLKSNQQGKETQEAEIANYSSGQDHNFQEGKMEVGV